MTTPSPHSFLAQAHRNNWQRYLESLQPGTARGWDVCVLTAGDQRQAATYERQLAWRRESGLLPAATRFVVVPDPPGRRVGSGGATLRVLAQIADEQPSAFSRQRVVVIHSGGDSRRLPHCSALGKLFARVPRVLPDGRASTVFDEFLIGLSGLASEAPPGVLLASGDVLLVFDHLQLALWRSGITGVAAAVPADMGTRHGVYVCDPDGQVRVYLHKPKPAEMAQWGAIAADGTVQIDTGLVWLAGDTAQRLARLTDQPMIEAVNLNLYGDLLLPLARSTSFEDYLVDTSDGPATPGLQAARRILWQQLRSQTPFGVGRLQPAVFVHFGSSREYWHMTAADPELAVTCGWTAHAAAWVPEGTDSGIVAINASVLEPVGKPMHRPPALVVDSQIDGPLTLRGAAILAGVRTAQPLDIPPATVISQIPVLGGFASEILGLDDDPKKTWDAANAGYMNRPWQEWLADAGLAAEEIWPALPPEARTLWNAQLFPITADREEGLRLALSMGEPQARPGWQAAWRSAPRLSLAQVAAQADGERLLNELTAVEDEAAARRFYAALVAEQPAGSARAILRSGAGPVMARRCQLVANWLAPAGPLLQLRGYRGLAEASGDATWDNRAFSTLADLIGCSPWDIAGRRNRTDREARGRLPLTVRVSAAARIDFGGGWTDTPPHSIERGGTVLNAAVTLNGTYPVIAEATRLSEAQLVLESRDLGAVLAPQSAGEILAYANPADPFALLKASLVLAGIVPSDAAPSTPVSDLMARLGSGLRLATATRIPRGSGLGTSSIMAGAVLACLDEILAAGTPAEEISSDPGPASPAGAPDTPVVRPFEATPQLFDDVLLLEQMLTTGGGWQDQAGGLVGGIKLLTTHPGLPQSIQIAPLNLTPATSAELCSRLALVYTGQQRLAKNLLRAVMGRWMGRDPEMVWLLSEIGRLARAMQAALEAGGIDTFGELIAEHWVLNKRMDPGCTNPFIDELFQAMQPYMNGAKLAGAGGGGFAIVVATSSEARDELGRALTRHFPGTPVSSWPCAVPAQGMTVGVRY